MRSKTLARISLFVLITFVLSLNLSFIGQLAQAEAGTQPVLITGTGLHQDVQINAEDWSKYNLVEQHYSSNNSFDFHKITKVKGYKLWDLIGRDNLKTDQDYSITFICSDGFKVTKKISELNSYYYPDFTEQKKENIEPMLAFYKVELVSYSIDSFNPPVKWEDRNITENDKESKAPRVVFGQQNRDDKNQSKWAQEIVKIVVGEERPTEDVDFSNSTYKHINYKGAPYNVDSITSATLTVEGPGVEGYKALSMRQLEEANEGLVRGSYQEVVDGAEKQNTYEGITVSYLLNNFVKLKNNAGKIIFKDKSRKEIAAFTLDEINKTGANNRNMIIAYGINDVPLVYLKSDTGYNPNKLNDNGCLKLVYGPKTAGDSPVPFSNVAYIYVEEANTAGVYEHTQAPYNDPRYTNYLLTLTGSGLGKEVNYTVEELESSAMDSIKHQDEYSLSNSEYYWYYNTYKGVKLWDLLLKAGLDPNIAGNTKVRFEAADNYNVPPLTIKEIKDSSLYGYYEKSADDLGDGKFDGSKVKPVKTGCPMLVAYGFNGYPYVIRPSDPGYNSGLLNDGGPLRIISGKTSYNHNNGSSQVQFLKKIIIGEEKQYTTHTFAPYDKYASSTLNIKVVDGEGSVIKAQKFTVTDLENMVYNIAAAEADKALVKDYFFTKVYQDSMISDLFEGVGLWYLLSDKVGLTGTTGTVTFKTEAGNTISKTLEEIKTTTGFNEVTGTQNIKPVIAYAKRGYPLVKDKKEAGEVDKNYGGPLMVVFGQTTPGQPGSSLEAVSEIIVNIEQDKWAHVVEPFDAYGSRELKISGNGAKKQIITTVKDLEALQKYIFTEDYCLLNKVGQKTVSTYKGIDLYEYLTKEVGLQPGATGIKIVASDGFSKSFTLEELAKRDYLNEESGTKDLKMMLAYGINQKPLVTDDKSTGYDAQAKNSGGPLQLIIGQTQVGDINSSKCVKNVAEIVIEGMAGESWKHDHGQYKQYEGQPVLRITGSQVTEPRTFTLKELEALDEHIVRDSYTGDGSHQLEGVILWNLISDVVGLKDGVTEPSIRVYSGANYNKVLQNMDQVKNGVPNTEGYKKDIILAYAQDGSPLVPDTNSSGYDNNNAFGPLRLIIEENKSMWVKCTDCIVVGTGDYEKPEQGDSTGELVVNSSTPVNGDTDIYSKTKYLKITFSDPLKAKTTDLKKVKLVYDYKGKTRTVRIKPTSKNSVLTIKILGAMKKNTMYTLTVPKEALKSSDGKLMTNDYQLTFTTGNK